MAANIARQTAIKMRVDAIVVLIGFVFDRPIMLDPSTIRQSKTILARSCEAHRGVSQLSIRVVELGCGEFLNYVSLCEADNREIDLG